MTRPKLDDNSVVQKVITVATIIKDATGDNIGC